MNRRYESIYNNFIEGQFASALNEKKVADSLYGTNYWTPQLLYIQSVYHIKQREDDQAKLVLQQIIKLYPESPLSQRAQTMLDVLGRRKEIEDYLTNLKIEKPADDSALAVADQPKPLLPAKTDSVQVPVNNADSALSTASDSLAAIIPAARDSLMGRSITQPTVIAKDNQVVETRKPDSIQIKGRDSVSDLASKPRTDSVLSDLRADTIQTVPPVVINKKADTVGSVPKTRQRPAINSVYTENAAQSHFVVVVLEKVDPVYVGEAKNAFNRYNKQAYYNNPIETYNQALNDSVTLVVMTPFSNAASAKDYADKTSEIADTRIIPWMPKGKFSFFIISQANLELLQNRKNIPEYLFFHKQAYPSK
jgi:hypothetical protein